MQEGKTLTERVRAREFLVGDDDRVVQLKEFMDPEEFRAD
jgi:hypothetical protein